MGGEGRAGSRRDEHAVCQRAEERRGCVSRERLATRLHTCASRQYRRRTPKRSETSGIVCSSGKSAGPSPASRSISAWSLSACCFRASTACSAALRRVSASSIARSDQCFRADSRFALRHEREDRVVVCRSVARVVRGVRRAVGAGCTG